MDIKSLDAAKAYGAALGAGVGLPAQGATEGAKSGFGALVEDLVQQTGDAVGTAETVSAKAVAGKADLVDVVSAVSNAELVLESVTAVRDRVISAYQEIIRMPI